MDASPGPASLLSLRDALLKGREPPPAEALARLSYYRWLVVGTVCIGGFMGQVDSSITQLLLPQLEHSFGARLSTVSWVALAYLLTMTAFLPIFGRLADMLGRKLLYTGGFLLFVLGSGLCGFAPSLPVLIACRVLQGIGAALLVTNSVAILVVIAGPERRGKALGVQVAAQAVGLSAGPVIGGFLLDTLGWQWVFWINVPFGLIGAVIGWFAIPPTKDLSGGGCFDWKGALLILPALTAFMMVVNEAHLWGVASPAFLGGAVVAIVLLALFVHAERRVVAPLVNLTLFRSAAFAAGSAAGLMSYAMLFGLFFLMPFLFMRLYQDSALTAGLRLAIVPVVLGLIAPFSGALSDRFGPRLLTVSGMAVCVAALALLYAAVDGTVPSFPFVMLALAGVGLGQGLFGSPNNNSIMAAAPSRVTGAAGGLMNIVRFCGMSIGVAAASALLSWRLKALTGHGSTVGVTPDVLARAGCDVILLIAGFAAVAAAILLARVEPRASAG
jgi:EmrB/QacA subfamily drug resistance transporter